MQLSPDTPLNLVVIRTVWRKKVKHNPAVEFLNGPLSDFAGMNNIVVQDYMDRPLVRILPVEFFEQLNKQCTAFASTFHPDHASGLSIHGSRKVVFDILARSPHGLLLSRQHVVRAYFGVQVNVDFVLV